jgi:hypothetical protein
MREAKDMTEEYRQFDEPLEESLDRLGGLLAPGSAEESNFVSRVMQKIEAAPAGVRRPAPFRRRLLYMAIGVAACLVVAIALWRTMAARQVPSEIVANRDESGNAGSFLSVPAQGTEAANSDTAAEPVMRTSTWSVVTESVVLEDDVPVRELLYREFERVEVLDDQGNVASHLVVPTKAMLLAREERY